MLDLRVYGGKSIYYTQNMTSLEKKHSHTQKFFAILLVKKKVFWQLWETLLCMRVEEAFTYILSLVPVFIYKGLKVAYRNIGVTCL